MGAAPGLGGKEGEEVMTRATPGRALSISELEYVCAAIPSFFRARRAERSARADLSAATGIEDDDLLCAGYTVSSGR